MTIEAANFVGELDQTLPTDDNDFVFEGDDHFRLVKKTLIQSFAAVLGAVVSTHVEMNALAGISAASTIETRLAALEAGAFQTGTVMLFAQTAAPTGWTIDPTNDDRLIRVDGVAGGTTAGSWTITGLTTDTHDDSHTHTVSGNTANNTQDEFKSGNESPAAHPNHSHSFSVTSGAKSGAQNHNHVVVSDGVWRPEYLDVVVCIKD